MIKTLKQLISQHWAILIVLVLATVLRVWQLDSQAIFFGDAGHDVLSAITALEEKKLPLLGIPSSVPRFRQGPVTVWIEMLVLTLSGGSLFALSLSFAMLSILAIILLYELSILCHQKQVGIIAGLLIAASPLAVSHARMMYHITPIPLMMVLFLWANVRLAQKKNRALFWAVLSWAGIFQFELATAPLFGVILWSIWKHQLYRKKSSFFQIALGLAIGLFPQIIYDITHTFSHLGGFAIWVVYRLGSALTGGSHQIDLTSIQVVAQTFVKYIGLIFSAEIRFFSLLGIIAAILACYTLIKKWRTTTIPPLLQITLLSTALLTIGFFIHGGPSEAYFPPFLILVPLLVASGISLLPQPYLKLTLLVVLILTLHNSFSIFAHNFFVTTTKAYQYGYSLAEQRNIVAYIHEQSQGEFQFKTTAQTFPSYFDNLRVVAWEQGTEENSETGMPFYIESKHSSLDTYPGLYKASFTTVDVYHFQ